MSKPYNDTTSWDPYVENITDVDTYLRRKFRQDVTDPSTGLNQQELKPLLQEIVQRGKAAGEAWCVTKAKCFSAQAERMAIDVSPFDWFPAISIWNRWDRPISGIIYQRMDEVNNMTLDKDLIRRWREGNDSARWTMWQDYDHSVPDWREIIPIGFPGLAKRVADLANRDEPFDHSLKITADAMLGCLDRFILRCELKLGGAGVPNSTAVDLPNISQSPNVEHRTSNAELLQGATRLAKELASLKRLRAGAPETAYDLMLFIWLYFFFEEHLDGFQCRSLTELDVFLTPYYERDIAAGCTTETEFREQLKHFIWQWGSIANYWNHPIGLGGTKRDGSSEYNGVSKIILDVMDECALPSPKFLVKVNDNTPDWAWNKMLDLARRRRSIAFLGEESMAKGMRIMCPTVTDDDCRELVMWGCYEYALRDGANTTLPFCPSLLKPVEEILALAASGAVNALSFDEFLSAYFSRLGETLAEGLNICTEIERHLADINPSCVMTVATEHAICNRRDAFADGCRRGNDTVVRFCGLGTAVDALIAVKKIVFERELMSLAELGKVMAADWDGHDELRLKMLRSKCKWGNNDPDANALGARISRFCSDAVTGRPNARGGHYFASGHTSRRYIEHGLKIGATPDGRKRGDEVSKNLSPTMGADTEGPTSLVATLRNASVAEFPGDAPLDMMLHPSTCDGMKGLSVMRTLVNQYHAGGGTVIQFTVFSADELRDAQKCPEKYEDLQVRVCGWNVRWNDLCKTEQDAFIKRAENI